MKNTANKTKTHDIINLLTKTKVASKAFAANKQQNSFQKLQQSAPPTSIPICIVCKGNRRLWECRVFNEIHSELWSLLQQSSLSLVCVINIRLDNVQFPVNVEKIGATAPKTPYFTELKRFPQPNPQITTSRIRSRTQVQLGQLLVNSNQAKRPLCFLCR